MAILGGAALAVWLEPLPEAEPEFDRWYVEEHLRERVALPGFLRGRRYRAVRGAPKFFALYEAENVDVFRSSAYADRLNNPTELTRRVMPAVRGFTRGVYHRRHTQGGGEGPEGGRAVVTLRLGPVPGREEALRARYRDAALPAMARVPGVRSAAFFEADPAAAGGPTVERQLIGGTATASPFVCVCELEDAPVADRPAWRALVGPNGPARPDALGEVVEGVYAFVHGLSHADV